LRLGGRAQVEERLRENLGTWRFIHWSFEGWVVTKVNMLCFETKVIVTICNAKAILRRQKPLIRQPVLRDRAESSHKPAAWDIPPNFSILPLGKFRLYQQKLLFC
jgi:hypothetical protein